MKNVPSEGAIETDLGVTAHAQLLLSYLTGAVRRLEIVDRNHQYRVIEAHAEQGTLLLEQTNSKNTFLVSVAQLTEVAHV